MQGAAGSEGGLWYRVLEIVEAGDDDGKVCRKKETKKCNFRQTPPQPKTMIVCLTFSLVDFVAGKLHWLHLLGFFPLCFIKRILFDVVPCYPQHCHTIRCYFDMLRKPELCSLMLFYGMLCFLCYPNGKVSHSVLSSTMSWSAVHGVLLWYALASTKMQLCVLRIRNPHSPASQWVDSLLPVKV